MILTGFESNDAIREEIGHRIRDIRIAQNLKQSDLARFAGVSLSTLKNLESGGSVGVEALLNVLRGLQLLSNIDLLVPGQQVHPMEAANGVKKRQRASGKRQKAKGAWKWGDEV